MTFLLLHPSTTPKTNVYIIYIYVYINIMRGKKDATTFPD